MVRNGVITAELIENIMSMRTELIGRLMDPRRDIDAECGYPASISIDDYMKFYKREGVARRAVTILPEESWAINPEIYEQEELEATPFEEAWKALVKEHNCFHYLEKVDEISGIGRFGLLLLGFDDGKALDQPLEGIDLRTGKVANPTTNADPTPSSSPAAPSKLSKLMYMRAFDESCVTIQTREKDVTKPRYGKPNMYSIVFKEPEGTNTETSVTLAVHWTRVIHVADNCLNSQVYGTPRMEIVFNRIMDLRKVLAGSGEMFWRGAFPGLSIETDPTLGADVEMDVDAIKGQLELYQNGLQRYLALVGVHAQSLAPQIADPRFHLEGIMTDIAIAIGVPKRILFGTEEAKLAATQDVRTWNLRISRRQQNYLTPMLLYPFLERLIAIGALPQPKDIIVAWPDRNTLTDDDKASVAVKRTTSLAAYIAGGVEAICPPQEFLSIILEMEDEEVKRIMEAAEAYAETLLEKQVEEQDMAAEGAKKMADAVPPPPKAAPGTTTKPPAKAPKK